MDTKKVVIVLLIVAIIFSAFSVITTLTQQGSFASCGQQNSRTTVGSGSGGGVSLTVLPSLVLGVLNGI
jgi:hypothetical protein